MLRGKLGKKAMAICLAASSVLLIACGGSTAQESGTPDSSAKGTEVALSLIHISEPTRP